MAAGDIIIEFTAGMTKDESDFEVSEEFTLEQLEIAPELWEATPDNNKVWLYKSKFDQWLKDQMCYTVHVYKEPEAIGESRGRRV